MSYSKVTVYYYGDGIALNGKNTRQNVLKKKTINLTKKFKIILMTMEQEAFKLEETKIISKYMAAPLFYSTRTSTVIAGSI